MRIIGILLVCCQCCLASTWTFHCAQGVAIFDVHWNDWLFSDTYGVSDGSWLVPADGWFVSDGGSFDHTFQPGNTITVTADYFGTTLTAWDFYSLNQIGGEVPIPDKGGEFWIDLGPDGLPRVSAVAPLAPKKHHGKK